MASFLLQCNICPKHPHFSDLSHLLTHVGSKGHLSHYFKAQVRSRQEPSIRDQLRAYDHWYQVNQVEKLLSQRMILKESKSSHAKSKTEEKAASRLKSAPRTTSGSGARIAVSFSPEVNENVLDPQLSSQALQSHRLPSTSASQLSSNDLESNQSGYPSRIHSRNASTRARRDIVFLDSRSTHGPQPSGAPKPIAEKGVEDEDQAQINEVKNMYPELPKPFQPFDVGVFRHRLTTPVNCQVSDAVTVSTDADGNEVEEIDELASECTKLKGICWPGMDIFDSASPDARRKRNQKKDGSILEQMKANSACVEPTELIFFENGDFKKSRYISGQVESSPIREGTPKPKRQRIRNPRAALTNMSGNIARATKKFRAAKANGAVPCFTVEPLPRGLDGQQSTSAYSQSIHALTGGNLVSANADHELEWALMIEGLQESRRRDFEVYNKGPVRPEATGKQARMDDSRTTSLPFLHENPDALPPHESRVSRIDYSHPHLPAQSTRGMAGLRPLQMGDRGFQATSQFLLTHNKENIQPLLDQTGRIADIGTPFHPGRSIQRYFATQPNGSTQYFASLPPYMDFAALQPPQQQGYLLNPLAFTVEQPTTQSATSGTWLKSVPVNPSRKLNYGTDDIGSRTFESNVDSGDETIDEEVDHETMLIGGTNVAN